MAACLLLTIGLVLLVEQPDEVVRSMRRHGSLKTRYYTYPSGPDKIAFAVIVPGATADATGVYRDLVSTGWRPQRHSNWVQLIDGRGKSVTFVDSYKGTTPVGYVRDATAVERRIHALKELFDREE
jgi:hypothetical protein